MIGSSVRYDLSGPVCDHRRFDRIPTIFMWHRERGNHVLGPEWFLKALHTHTYHNRWPYPIPILTGWAIASFLQNGTPVRSVSVRFLQIAWNTAMIMVKNNLIVDLCLSSTALGCAQSSERLFKARNRRKESWMDCVILFPVWDDNKPFRSASNLASPNVHIWTRN